jgi:hypothetical protein
MPRKALHDRVAALPLLLPRGLRGTLRTLYKAIVPERTIPLDQAIRWLIALREAGVAFGFPDDLQNVPLKGKASPLALVKHDIHDNLDRAVGMARAEHERSIAGLYFMMGPHALNKSFYGSERTWEKLRTIQSLGHRIGLHLDIYDALRTRGLYEFIADALADFSREGISLQYANSHGDQKYAVLGATPANLFAELAEMRRGPTETAAKSVAAHVGEYSLKHLAERFGLTYWVDGRIMREGIPLRRTIYVSDNGGYIRINSGNLSSRPFEIDPDFVAASVQLLRTAQSLILLHPQWYVSQR